MTVKRIALIWIVSILLLSACQANTDKTDSNDNTNGETSVPIHEANNDFGLQMIELAYDETENVFLSPTSALLAMLMAYNGADGETKAEIEHAFLLEGYSLEEINAASKQLIADLENMDETNEVAIANSLWINDDYTFQADFAKQVETYYNATIEEIDISDHASADRINDWVKEQTNDKITDIVEAPLPNDLLAYIINALYFNGTWKYEFDKSLTIDLPFYGTNEEKQVPFMTLIEELPYLETDQFKAVKLPYGDGDLSMQIYLPNEDESLPSMIESLTNNWSNWQTKFTLTEGTVVMPKFTLEYELILNDLLQQLGITSAFDERLADFTNMAETTEQIYISEVKQKTYIDVNEEGTEAAATTSVEMLLTSAPVEEEETFHMEVNRPFLFTIQDDGNDHILFIGTMQIPEQAE